MSNNLKIQDTHRRRCAYLYIRQSSATQVPVNRESSDRQYQLSERAVQLGWSKTQIKVIDEDWAHTGSGLVTRHGFAHRTHELAMGQVAIILCLEAFPVPRHTSFAATSTSSVPSSSREVLCLGLLRLRERVDGLWRRIEQGPSANQISPTPESQQVIMASGAVERSTSSDSTNISPAHASTAGQSGQPPGSTHSEVGARTSPKSSSFHQNQKP